MLHTHRTPTYRALSPRPSRLLCGAAFRTLTPRGTGAWGNEAPPPKKSITRPRKVGRVRVSRSPAAVVKPVAAHVKRHRDSATTVPGRTTTAAAGYCAAYRQTPKGKRAVLRYNVVRNLKSLAEYAKPGGRWDSDTTIKEKKELFAGRAAEINCTITWEDDTPGCIVGIIAATATVAAAAQQGPQQGGSTALVVQPASGADSGEGAGAMGRLLLLVDATLWIINDPEGRARAACRAAS